MDVLALLLLLQMDARIRGIHHPPPERILWIGAHPDDEALVAPLLGRACIENGAVLRCHERHCSFARD